jgi:hypothetical protein
MPYAAERSSRDRGTMAIEGTRTPPWSAGGRRIVIVIVAVTVALLALGVWPGPMLWQGPSLEFGARVVVRDPVELDLPRTAGAVAATVIAPWKEPVRIGDQCARRAVVSMPAGWTFASLLKQPGWRVVEQSGASVTIEVASGADRIARPTFVGSAQLPVSEVQVTIQRVCDGVVTALGTLQVTDVVDETPVAGTTS